MSEHLGPFISAITGVLAAGIAYGVLKTRVDAQEKSIDRAWQAFESYVTKAHFDAVVDSLRENALETRQDIAAIRADIKELVHMLQKDA